MEKFIIKADESWLKSVNGGKALCLQHDVVAFYNFDYHGGGNWKREGTNENMICTLKNDRTPYSQHMLEAAVNRLEGILLADLPKILSENAFRRMRVCVVPRAKREEHYMENQRLFRNTIQQALRRLSYFEDGSHDIIRHTDTRTTHSDRSGNGGNGDKPYCGITMATCHISNNVRGKDILLIDDLYTKTIGIDEDAIQALYDSGAKCVFFYAIGKTVKRY